MASEEELQSWDKELTSLFNHLIIAGWTHGKTRVAPSKYEDLPGVREILLKRSITREDVNAIIEIIANYIPMENLDFSSGDAAKWGVSDFYDEPEKALKDVLERRAPFATGWFSSSKEPQSAKITRPTYNGPIELEVSVCMDSGSDIVDTIIWEAGNKKAGSGFDLLLKTLKADRAVEKATDALLDSLRDAELIFDENCESETETLARDADFIRVTSKLSSMANKLERKLEGRYKEAIKFTRNWLPTVDRFIQRDVLDWSPDEGDEPEA